MKKKSKIDHIKSLKMLNIWGQLPNPDYKFITSKGGSYHSVLKDLTYMPEIQSAILARESAVIGDPWEIVSDNPEASNFVKNNLINIGINSVFRNIYHALWYGYTILQHPMELVNDKWVYTKINSLPCDWFAFDANNNLIPHNHSNLTPFNLTVGDLEKEVELVQYRPTFTNPYGESILARVFWIGTWIRGDMELWLSYLDRFGDDSIIGKMDIGDDHKKMQMLNAISQFKSSGAIVIEGSDQLEVLKTDKTNSSSLFKNFYDICNQQISKLILGHASALEAQAGKLGNDQSLSIVRQDITEDDKSLIEEVINRLIQHLCIVNNITDNVKFFFSPASDDQNAKIERDLKIAKLGFEFSEKYIRDTYRLGELDITKISPQSNPQ